MSTGHADDNGTAKLIGSALTGFAHHLSANFSAAGALEIIRVAFSAAMGLVSFLVGVAGLIKFWFWLQDKLALRDVARRALQAMLDRIAVAEKGRHDAEDRLALLQAEPLVQDMAKVLTGETPIEIEGDDQSCQMTPSASASPSSSPASPP